jgi:catalase
VPGIDVTPDPLLQGRLFSYQDTQLIRLGGPNFHEIPVNAPVCPFRNFQRDGHMQMQVPAGRVSYEPNSLDPDGPAREPDARLQELRRSGVRAEAAAAAGDVRRPLFAGPPVSTAR